MESNTILSECRRTISLEIEQLEKLLERIDERYSLAVSKIYESKGKLVVVGVGKSAHIANKIVATMNSTGTPSQFLHATEAVHGDLGLLKKEDIALCISNSGNSPEIQNVVPYLVKNSSFLIGMTGNLSSFLAQHAHVVLDSSVTQEACPNNLAPTTSTTVQIAIGDALAVALMNLRDFKEVDFAEYHPGGALGKNLLWSVEQIVNLSDKPFVYTTSTVKEIISSLVVSKSGITVVLDENKVIQGVITDGDLRRMLADYEDYSMLLAKDIMSENPKVIDKNELAKTAYDLLHKYDIGQLVVVDGKSYYGILDIHQLLEQGIG
ncbi:MAG: KpsF/GutQ family sugar-phosphate isomerase [Flavobacteriales bacterium]|nr:KpsF/GutQ family sugar-phosphate isomerase [Flavobacteriales bacterium]